MAAWTFAAALVSKQTANLATKAIRKYVAKEAPPDEENAKIHITCFPAHTGCLAGLSPCNPNEEVHRLACELTNPAAAAASSGRVYSDPQSDKDPVITYHELTSHYREGRRLFPAPHPKLSRAQSITLRQLQKRTYITPAVMHRINADTTPTCPFCDHAHSNFEHMIWLCPANSLTELATQEAWNKAIMSPKFQHQLRAVQRARDIAARLRPCQRHFGRSPRASHVLADLR
ncbi:hypothetical protein HPB50_013063 [Hyalomma asiaticum]|uniref:Uncharacterized protein n=1 Tax=Hyalomma asiaticum TaxID=266040 RepID=A0ACB7SQ72_HYAAI|nr:hypothetical protein HPB50_013063 [Hyalomma asiaticum]